MVTEFFGCPQQTSKSSTPITTIRTNRQIKTGNIVNKNTAKDDDSILISIFIGIVITACLTTIILSFITISGIIYFYYCAKRRKRNNNKFKINKSFQ